MLLMWMCLESIVVVVVVVVELFSGGFSGHVAGDHASHGAYAGLS